MAYQQRAQGLELDPTRVRDKMAQACPDRGLLDYMSNMWTQVLDGAEACGAASWHDRWGELQLPYLPVEPERYDVELTASSEVLDVGCLSGYGMYDVHRRRSRSGLPVPRLTGVDNDPAACDAGQSLMPMWTDGASTVRFVRGDLSRLPFPAQRFDVVIARCVLAYVHLPQGLRELRRMLRPRGLAVIQVHAPRYYWTRARAALRSPRRLAYYVRPLVSGAVLGATGRPPRSPLFRETALTAHGLMAQARHAGLSPLCARPTPYRPLVVFRAT